MACQCCGPSVACVVIAAAHATAWRTSAVAHLAACDVVAAAHATVGLPALWLNALRASPSPRLLMLRASLSPQLLPYLCLPARYPVLPRAASSPPPMPPLACQRWGSSRPPGGSGLCGHDGARGGHRSGRSGPTPRRHAWRPSPFGGGVTSLATSARVAAICPLGGVASLATSARVAANALWKEWPFSLGSLAGTSGTGCSDAVLTESASTRGGCGSEQARDGDALCMQSRRCGSQCLAGSALSAVRPCHLPALPALGARMRCLQSLQVREAAVEVSKRVMAMRCACSHVDAGRSASLDQR